MSRKYTKEEIVDFLRSVSVMSIAVELDGQPISSVLLFAVDDDLIIYFATRTDSFKSKALSKNQKISLSVWEHRKMLVQAKGFAEKITDSGESEIALDKIVNSAQNIENFWPPILSITGGEYEIFRLKLDWIRVLDLSDLMIKEEEMPFSEFNL